MSILRQVATTIGDFREEHGCSPTSIVIGGIYAALVLERIRASALQSTDLPLSLEELAGARLLGIPVVLVDEDVLEAR